MNRRQAMYYFFLQQHYFAGLAMMLSVLSLGFYFVFGLNPANIQLLTFLKLYVPAVVVCIFMMLWLQQFNIRPKLERGLLLTSIVLDLAAWPVFFMALMGVIRGKRLVYKVTPKGQALQRDHIEFAVFKSHLVIGALCLIFIIIGVFNRHESIIMLFWAALATVTMAYLPFSLVIYQTIRWLKHGARRFVSYIHHLNKFYEFNKVDPELLPSPVTDTEKYIYSRRRHNSLLIIISLLSFAAVIYSMARYALHSPLLPILSVYLIITVIYFIVSILVNAFTKDFNIEGHKALVQRWKPKSYPSVDVFLPTAGEPIAVLENTWLGVQEAIKAYPGNSVVYCLDDSNSNEVKQLAESFKFRYEVRPNRGELKKAGNLRHGYKISQGNMIAIFDADFRPRYDIFLELLPYFSKDNRIGIVQSPQYFSVNNNQTWLERGAGAVQELFYRYAQVSRQNYDAAICVGSNAIYRRAALDDIGGTALIEHSEDVHTGFNIRQYGWKLQYVPVVLAKGLCPSSMTAFFKQQYRWCLGSMSLLSSGKFWRTQMSWRARTSYVSGFLYYFHTGISSLFVPLIPLFILVTQPNRLTTSSELLILPSLVFAQIIFPVWHRAIYGIEAWSTRTVYGWAHLFAVVDSVTHRSMQWQPTGSRVSVDGRYIWFRVLQFLFNFVPAVTWASLAICFMFTSKNPVIFIPISITGLYFFFVTLKVTLYRQRATQMKPVPTRADVARARNTTVMLDKAVV
jgi:cellulose synthase (UDP-forming)